MPNKRVVVVVVFMEAIVFALIIRTPLDADAWKTKLTFIKLMFIFIYH